MPLTIPAITPADLNQPIFNLPTGIADPMYSIVQRPDAATIASGTVGGDGIFDKFMASMSVHLKAEYEKNRITGAEYTRAYIELTTACLSSAVQFALGREQAFWQAQQGQVAAITGRVQLETARITHAYVLPAQYNLVSEQGEAQRAQTMDNRFDGTPVVGVLGKQKALYTQQIDSYKRDAETKAVKLFTDAWITQKTIDEGLLAPNNFANAALDEVLAKLRTNLALYP